VTVNTVVYMLQIQKCSQPCANSFSSSEAPAFMSHKTRSFRTPKFSIVKSSATAMTSVIASAQSRFQLVDYREKSVRLLFPKFHCFNLAVSTWKSQRRGRPARSIWTCQDRSGSSPTCLPHCPRLTLRPAQNMS